MTSGVLKENFLRRVDVRGPSSSSTLPVVAVEGDDELLVAAVAAEDQASSDEDGEPPLPWTGAYLQVGVAPEDLAVEVEAGGPLVAEVDVEPLAVDERRRAGVAVLAVDGRGRLAVLAEDFRVPEDLARRRVQAEGPQRLVVVGRPSTGTAVVR